MVSGILDGVGSNFPFGGKQVSKSPGFDFSSLIDRINRQFAKNSSPEPGNASSPVEDPVSLSPPPDPNGSTVPGTYENLGGLTGGGLVGGNVSLDLYFKQTEYRQSGYSYRDGNQSVTASQSYYHSFEASLSLDFSFLTQYDQTANKVANLDPAVLQQFSDAASKLTSLNEGDLQNFLDAVDTLFNEFEKASGLTSDQLNGSADFFKNAVSDFIHMVQDQFQKFDQAPTTSIGNQSPDGSIGDQGQPPPKVDIQGPLDKVLEMLRQHLKDVREKLLKQSLDPNPVQTGTGDNRQNPIFPFLQNQGTGQDPTQQVQNLTNILI